MHFRSIFMVLGQIPRSNNPSASPPAKGPPNTRTSAKGPIPNYFLSISSHQQVRKSLIKQFSISKIIFSVSIDGARSNSVIGPFASPSAPPPPFDPPWHLTITCTFLASNVVSVVPIIYEIDTKIGN